MPSLLPPSKPLPSDDEFCIPQFLATRYVRLSADKQRVIPHIVVREIGLDGKYPVVAISEYRGFASKAAATAWQSRELTRMNATYPGLYVLQRIVDAGLPD